ncbi:F0F1 ATP synthase subunit A [Geodermatophilus sabuli]|uniref:ATP synthase subunit a n=1 Tax=Geodermatophilus sabuli TaxID=1564158 RepID=A0A285EH08_9ACTN|nr:F0F1 ATP synthase subunit A [Geodermatophilus sabuli]MBB3085938.1 F-type H+-transporting ATPase subunit a [Geodermatophilus sabuli]SNX98280.1 ATP synthase F0 subcomplex A subunit [Geodermatophilus sabuli]
MTSSALALGNVLAAESGGGDGFQAPGLGEFYPEVVASFSLFGIAFEITRITIILWVATLALIAFLVATVRKPSIVPGKLQFVGESGYSLVRDGIARDVVGPKGLPFAPFLASLFFFILANNLMAIIPFAQISPMSKFAFPLVLAAICWVMYIWIGIREQGAGKYFKDILFLPGVPKPMYVLVTPIEILQNFVVRPFTLAVRLFANMFAGHMLLVVFSLGAVYLFQVGNYSMIFGPISALMAIVMTFFELLVIFLQAYVFTVLMGTYLNGSIEAEH